MTRAESLFGSITKLQRTDSNIFILDATHSKSLLVFDNSGRFWNSIGLHGRGPGELIYIMDFCIDEEEESVIITCNTGKILKTDIHGNVINEVKHLAGALTNIIYYNGSYYGYTGARPGQEYGSYQIVKLDRNLEIEEYFLPFNDPLPVLLRNPNALYKYKGEVFFLSIIDNAIYQLKEDSFTIKYFFDFGAKALNLKDISSPDLIFGTNYSFLWNYVVEGDSLILMSVFDNGRPWLAFLHKGENKLYIVESIIEDVQGFTNPISHFAGRFISVIASHKFLKDFPLWSNTVSPDDNPLLLEYRIKSGFR